MLRGGDKTPLYCSYFHTICKNINTNTDARIFNTVQWHTANQKQQKEQKYKTQRCVENTTLNVQHQLGQWFSLKHRQCLHFLSINSPCAAIIYIVKPGIHRRHKVLTGIISSLLGMFKYFSKSEANMQFAERIKWCKFKTIQDKPNMISSFRIVF